MPRGLGSRQHLLGLLQVRTDDDAPGASSRGTWVGALNTDHDGPMWVWERGWSCFSGLPAGPQRTHGQAGLSPSRTEARGRAICTLTASPMGKKELGVGSELSIRDSQVHF